MRVCAYYPMEILDRDEEGQIINEHDVDGFEDNFIDIITYDGEVNNEDHGNYKLVIPEIPELNRSNILDKLANINYTGKKLIDHYLEDDEELDSDCMYEDEDEDDNDNFYYYN